MRIKIIFDKVSENKNLYTGWGVSFLINDEVLFDTGENGSWLINNLKVLKTDIDKISAVVISHDHWDHTGGLWELLKKKKDLTVYGCSNFSAEFKKNVKNLGARLLERENFTEIAENIFVTGEIAGAYKGAYMPEQALAVKTGRGITVVTGCAHPGIVKITETVKDKFPGDKTYFVFGGFHLAGEDSKTVENIAKKLKEMGVEKAGPTHCSGPEAENIFKKLYQNGFLNIVTGMELEV
ncbi:MAG: MBL fold metallo-hydrolase [Candidatus Omnitrophica bacterium]|nr:MBL fold metallo-hydrolase [Candidatus Omnitrophota bacterium]